MRSPGDGTGATSGNVSVLNALVVSDGTKTTLSTTIANRATSGDPLFHTTHWSRIAAAAGNEGEASQAALADLCQAYWYPLYAFLRRRGHNAEDARDLTQGFFAALLE